MPGTDRSYVRGVGVDGDQDVVERSARVALFRVSEVGVPGVGDSCGVVDQSAGVVHDARVVEQLDLALVGAVLEEVAAPQGVCAWTPRRLAANAERGQPEVDQIAVQVDRVDLLGGGEAERGQAPGQHVAVDLGVLGERFAQQRDRVVVEVVDPVVVKLHVLTEDEGVVPVLDLAVVDDDAAVLLRAGDLGVAGRGTEPVPDHLFLGDPGLALRAGEVLVLAVAAEMPAGDAAVEHAVLEGDVLVPVGG
ncbi:MAG: hypothetical protein ACRDO2_01030 [Nocardioidaceae bacterium]